MGCTFKFVFAIILSKLSIPFNLEIEGEEEKVVEVEQQEDNNEQEILIEEEQNLEEDLEQKKESPIPVVFSKSEKYQDEVFLYDSVFFLPIINRVFEMTNLNL